MNDGVTEKVNTSHLLDCGESTELEMGLNPRLIQTVRCVY